MTAAVLDFETQSSFPLGISVSDGAGGSYTEQFTITVSDVADGGGPAPAVQEPQAPQAVQAEPGGPVGPGTPGNTVPVAVDDTVAATEDTQLDLPVSGAGSPAENDTDANANALSVTAVSGATGGTASIAAGVIQFGRPRTCAVPARAGSTTRSPTATVARTWAT